MFIFSDCWYDYGFERGPPKNNPRYVPFNLAQWLQRKILKHGQTMFRQANWIKIVVFQMMNLLVIWEMSYMHSNFITKMQNRGRRGRECMVVGFTTTYKISAYHNWCCEFESRSGRGVQYYVIKFVSDLQQVGGFLWVLRFPPPIKLAATI